MLVRNHVDKFTPLNVRGTSFKVCAMQVQSFTVKGQAGAREGHHVLCVKGPITLSTASVFQDAVWSVGAPCLIIDLTEVPFIDSAAIGVLVRAYVSCQKVGRRLALVGLGLRVKNVLHLTGIDPLFDTYVTVSEAEERLA